MPTRIVTIESCPVDLPLREPFGIATGAQHRARNVLVRIELDGGAEGWGEAAPFTDVNGETQSDVLAAIEAVRSDLLGFDARSWRTFAGLLNEKGTRSAAARCALETALLDALATHFDAPLWVLLGGSTARLETDLTITTGTPEHARNAALAIARDGYRTIKLKVGGVDVAIDVERIRAVVEAAPACGLLLDGNTAVDGVDAAVKLIEAARSVGGRVVLFEQPLARDAHEGMRAIAARTGVRVAADEGAACVADVVNIAHERSAAVVNLKIMKSGVIEAMRMAAVARGLGLGLMIGGMVESELAMSMSASIAAGLGEFEFVDLDTPLWLVDSPIAGGYEQRGPELDLTRIRSGHGARPRPGTIDIGRSAR